MFGEDGDTDLASAAANRLSSYGQYREFYPPESAKRRIEYRDGVPRCPNVFILPQYCDAYLDIRESGTLTDDQDREIREVIAESATSIFTFPEWGAHNRTTLRAWALAKAVKSPTTHAHRTGPRWLASSPKTV